MATIFQNESAWSTTESTNANVDTGMNWAELQDPASINNSARGMMAARAKARLDQGGYLLALGSANELTVTTNQGLSSAHLSAGLRILVRTAAVNTAAVVTLAVDGLLAVPIKRADGSVLAVGSISAGMVLDLAYNSGAGEWWCLNIAPLQPIESVIFPIPPGVVPPVVGAALASFSISKASSQTVNVLGSTVVTFAGGADFNVGNYYAPNTWTPPAGTAFVGADLQIINNSGSAASFGISLYRGGVIVAQNVSDGTIASGQSLTLPLSRISQVTGSQAFYIATFSSAQPYNIASGVQTRFYGYMI